MSIGVQTFATRKTGGRGLPGLQGSARFLPLGSLLVSLIINLLVPQHVPLMFHACMFGVAYLVALFGLNNKPTHFLSDWLQEPLLMGGRIPLKKNDAAS